ncbi:MAG: STAS domain-containing protein [Planctomycetia bacterium]|nr:STAS domain-containing protein [Planctomycetia bacterium]
MAEIRELKEGDKLTVSISGRLDTNTSSDIESKILGMLNGVSSLLIDLSELEYISSAGLRTLLTIQKVFASQGEMKLVNIKEKIMDIFEITGFTAVLNIIK